MLVLGVPSLGVCNDFYTTTHRSDVFEEFICGLVGFEFLSVFPY